MNRRPAIDDREELERFKREVNLCEFAAARGYQLDRKESSRGSVVMRHQGTHDKIIISRSAADQHWTYFSVRDDADNGTVIDFLQRRDRVALGHIRQELRSWLGAERRPVAPEEYVPNLVSPERDRAAVARIYEAASPVANSVYLNSRGIRPETLAAQRFRDTFRQDGRGNVLFPHRDQTGLTGFESKNYDWTAFAAGGTKALWSSQVVTTDNRLVITESAIDALSHYQLQPDPHTRYLSTAGTLNPHQLPQIAEEVRSLPAGGGVVAAFDADAGGEKLAELVRSVAGPAAFERAAPPAKDWNEVLKRREREYILSIGRGRRGPEL